MNEESVRWIVGGVLLLVLVNKLSGLPDVFADSPETKAMKALASRFDDPADLWELWAPVALTDALVAGLVTTAQVTASIPYAPRIDQARKDYKGAKGWVYDSESKAVTAISGMPNYVCLLTLGQNFFNNYGETLGGYGVSFLEKKDKAAIVNIVLKLRKK